MRWDRSLGFFLKFSSKTAFFLALTCNQCNAEKGIINFSGEIVNPPYQVSLKHIFSSTATGSRAIEEEVSLFSSSGDRLSAKIFIQSSRRFDVLAVLTDRVGKRVDPKQPGHYEIADGGKLSIRQTGGFYAQNSNGILLTVQYD